MKAIIQSPVPVIAAVDGIAVAAGCQLVTACDIAICTERSSFATPGYINILNVKDNEHNATHNEILFYVL